jgi:2-keto-4-pentenoate hydratase/2-oxohepta-3-ene-1,7-dioic acid hydratase in catechol pathway
MKIIQFIFNKKVYFGNIEKNNVRFWTKEPWNKGKKTKKLLNINKVKLLPPCNPKKILAIADNYSKYTNVKSRLKKPLVFFKNPTSLIQDNEHILSPFKKRKVWGEPELGLVIGKKLKDATWGEAKKGIFGYIVVNDVSASDSQNYDHHLAQCKGVDTFCAIGKFISTDFKPGKKSIYGFQNKTLLRKGFLHLRKWQEPGLLVWLSSWITLDPGDLILTGAPKRVKKRLYLKNGDSYTCQIEGLGFVHNYFKLRK